MEKKPFVSFTAYDEDGNEVTSTIEVELETLANAVELWQYLRLEADRWCERFDFKPK